MRRLMSNRRLVVLSIFASTLAVQACLVAGCSGDDSGASGATNEDAGQGIFLDGAAPDGTTRRDASTSGDSSIATDATIDDANDDANDGGFEAASDGSTMDANDGSVSDGGSDASSTTDAGADAGAAPSVVTTSPASGDTGVAKRSDIVVTFSEAMNPATLTTNTTDATCSGSIQVSSDAFATCVQMTAAPASSNGATTFLVTPAADLPSLSTYQIRVTTSAASATSVPLAAEFTTAANFTVRYFHTIVIDGVNDFTTNETFTTTSTASGYSGYLAWDDTYMYVGLSGADVGSNDASRFILVYFGGTAGTTTGVTYNTQTESLPFSAQYHVRWKADNSFTDALAWNGTSWTEASWNFAGDVYQAGTYFEMRVPLVNIGSPSSVALHVSMVNTTASFEGTFSGVPATSFTDGYDPAYTKYLQLGLQGPAVPNASPVLP